MVTPEPQLMLASTSCCSCLDGPVRRDDCQDGAEPEQYLDGMSARSTSRGYDRVLERRRAVALARHFHEAEGLSVTQIADRLGRSPATIKAYFYDPTGEKARAVKARYVGLCRGCGAYTQAQRQGRRVRVLQALPPGGDPAALDAGAGAGGDERVERALRAAAVVV